MIHTRLLFSHHWHINTSSAVTPGLYLGMEKIGVTCLYSGGDSLLHVGICCKQFVSQVLLKGSNEIEITGPPHCHLDLWLVTALRLAACGPSYLQSWPRTQLQSKCIATNVWAHLAGNAFVWRPLFHTVHYLSDRLRQNVQLLRQPPWSKILHTEEAKQMLICVRNPSPWLAPNSTTSAHTQTRTPGHNFPYCSVEKTLAKHDILCQRIFVHMLWPIDSRIMRLC